MGNRVSRGAWLVNVGATAALLATGLAWLLVGKELASLVIGVSGVILFSPFIKSILGLPRGSIYDPERKYKPLRWAAVEPGDDGIPHSRFYRSTTEG